MELVRTWMSNIEYRSDRTLIFGRKERNSESTVPMMAGDSVQAVKKVRTELGVSSLRRGV